MSSEQKSKRKNNTIETNARLVPARKCTHTCRVRNIMNRILQFTENMKKDNDLKLSINDNKHRT